MKFSDAFQRELTERFYEGQTDIFDVIDPLPLREQAMCKKCGQLYLNQDARDAPAKAVRRGCWLVTNKLILCPVHVKERYQRGDH